MDASEPEVPLPALGGQREVATRDDTDSDRSDDNAAQYSRPTLAGISATDVESIVVKRETPQQPTNPPKRQQIFGGVVRKPLREPDHVETVGVKDWSTPLSTSSSSVLPEVLAIPSPVANSSEIYSPVLGVPRPASPPLP